MGKSDNSRIKANPNDQIGPKFAISGEGALDRASASFEQYSYIGQGGPGSSVDRANGDRSTVIAPIIHRKGLDKGKQKKTATFRKIKSLPFEN